MTVTVFGYLFLISIDYYGFISPYFQTKTELFCSGYGYLPHCNAENDHRKRSQLKTLSRVERFENDAF